MFLYTDIEGADIRDCTLTLIGARKPSAMTACLKETFGFVVEKSAEGVYYVKGLPFPIQIIETKRLSEQENLWLASLRDDLTARCAGRVLAESGKRREASIAAYLYALMTARGSVFQEVWDMKKQKVTFEQLWRKIGEESGQLEKLQQDAARQTKFETARRMKADGVDIHTICKYSDLAPADIAAL
jgi:hypothetical protein